MTFEYSRDVALIRSVVTHPAIFEQMFSDGGPRVDEYTPALDSGFVYIVVRDRGELAGLFICVPQTSVCWEMHACLLPHARGRQAIAIYCRGLEWFGLHSACRKAIGYTPAYNRAALYVARRAGFEVIGINKASIMKHGNLEDQIILGRAL